MKQINEDKLISESMYGEEDEHRVNPTAVQRMDRVTSDLEFLASMYNNPKVDDQTKASIENFFLNIKDYPI